MNKEFQKRVAEMPELFRKLESTSLQSRDQLDVPQQGIYIFYEDGVPLYVGRSNGLRERIQTHARPSSSRYSATFAFLLAYENAEEHNIPTNATRKELEQDPEFAELFRKAKQRVADMKVRTVEVRDQISQALFEIYAALESETRYNDFATH